MTLERRFETGARADESDAPGLVLGDDGIAYLVAPDGTRTPVGGGGSSAFVGSRVALSGNLPGWFGNAVPFDVVNYDTDGLWDGGQSKMVIPAGKDGIYQVSFLLGLNADVAITSFIAFVESDDPDISSGVDYVGVKYGGSGNWLASGSCPQKLVAGNTVFLDGGVNGAADATINQSLTFFAISYLGPLT